MKGLWLGFDGAEYYSYLPMPFHRKALIALVSDEHRPVSVEGRIRWRPEPLSAIDCLLHATRYDYTAPPAGQDYRVLDVKGGGHFAGIIMDRPGNMEGDDRFFVDGEQAPSIHGTGTEDFFNFAWGFGHLAGLELHGITHQLGTAVCYRLHLPAGVPFADSLRVTWEHGSGNTDGGRYAGVALYYLAGGAPTAVWGTIDHIPPESPEERAARHAQVAERRRRIPIMVHRGARQCAPENSLAAYNGALDLGADGVEIDIRRTRDGILYLYHDDDLVQDASHSN